MSVKGSAVPGSLGARLAIIGGSLLVETLDGLEAGTVEERAQDQAAASYAPKLLREDEILDWRLPSAALLLRIRALSPSPGASTRFRLRGLKVLRATGVTISSDLPVVEELPPGSVLNTVVPGASGVVVRTGDGAVRLEDVQPEGRRRMSGADFVRGYHPSVGDILGES